MNPQSLLAHYRILSKVGAGGMGVVYLALDTKLDRKAALKILPQEVASQPERMGRFIREARAAAALSHPHIAHIYEIGESDGVHFIAMEYVDGVTMREKIHGEQAELGKLLRYMQQVAEGLAKAHAAGIIHRDLKPDNIMITRDGHAKILDFGLAKLSEQTARATDEQLSAAPTAVMQRSQPGLVIGTVGYLSPEQAQGKVKEIDHRSDIFSFGCILFEVATARRAFEAESVIKSLHKVVYEPTPSVKDLNPSAPAELQRIVRRCLAKDPEDRYQTIKDVAIELKELQRELDREFDTSVPPLAASERTAPHGAEPTVTQSANAPVMTQVSIATPTTSAEYLVSEIKRHKLLAFLALLVVGAAATATALYVHSRSAPVVIDSIAVLPFENRSSDANTEYLSDGLTESLIYRLSQLPGLNVSPPSVVFNYKGKQTNSLTAGNELGVRAILSGRIVQRGDDLTISAELTDVRNQKLLWGEQYDRKVSDLLATQREIAREITERLRLKFSGKEPGGLSKHYTENNEAYQLYLKGRFYWNKRTADAMNKSIEYFNQAIEKDPNFALAYAGLADSYVVPANPLPPREKMPKAKAATMRALELDPMLAEAHTSLARVLTVYEWDWAGAEREFQRALDLNPRYPVAHSWYGALLCVTGRFDEGIAQKRRALELDPLSLTLNFELGLAFYEAHRFDEAIAQFQRTLELEPHGFPGLYIYFPAAYEQKGMYDRAIAEFQKGIPGTTGVEYSASMAGLGRTYALSGQKDEARKVLNQLRQRFEQQYVPADAIALVYASLSEKEEAVAWLEKAFEQHSTTLVRLKVESRWDVMRSDPRFVDLLRRMGLQQ